VSGCTYSFRASFFFTSRQQQRRRLHDSGSSTLNEVGTRVYCMVAAAPEVRSMRAPGLALLPLSPWAQHSAAAAAAAATVYGQLAWGLQAGDELVYRCHQQAQKAALAARTFTRATTGAGCWENAWPRPAGSSRHTSFFLLLRRFQLKQLSQYYHHFICS
jgi:hypothetical protein